MTNTLWSSGKPPATSAFGSPLAVDRAVRHGEGASGEGQTPLHCATYKGFIAGIKHLLAAGADPDTLNQEGHAAAMVAARGEDREVIEVLART